MVATDILSISSRGQRQALRIQFHHDRSS